MSYSTAVLFKLGSAHFVFLSVVYIPETVQIFTAFDFFSVGNLKNATAIFSQLDTRDLKL